MTSFPTPESIVRVEAMGPHFTKYHLGNGGLLHHFTKAEDEHYHDHPWPFRTSILSGGYVEEVAKLMCTGEMEIETVERLPGTSHEVKARTVHKLVGLIGTDCWTLLEPGEKEQEPGFYKADESGIWHRYWYEETWRILGYKKQ